MPFSLRLSVIIPVYNEADTIEVLIQRVMATGLPNEIIVVDDGSSDRTGTILERLEVSVPGPLRVLRHKKNRGKGAAVRTGLEAARGDLVLIQDADLEYDPADYPVLLSPFSNSNVQVVYGSRNRERHGHSSFAFYWGGRFLSWWTNRLYGSSITDEATCYKVVRRELLCSLKLRSEGFEFCPELTGKLLRRGETIHEVPISYHPRLWKDGKKIKWYDGLHAIWTLLRFRFSSEPGSSDGRRF